MVARHNTDLAIRVQELEGICDKLEAVNDRLRRRVEWLESFIIRHLTPAWEASVVAEVRMDVGQIRAYLRDQHRIDRTDETIRNWIKAARLPAWHRAPGGHYYTTQNRIDYAVSSGAIPP